MILAVLFAATIVTGSFEAQNSSYAQFQREFAAGADCPRLFQLRNDVKVRATEAQVQGGQLPLSGLRDWDHGGTTPRIFSPGEASN